jgi:hypothetical protein
MSSSTSPDRVDWRSRIDIPDGLAPRLARAGLEVADLFGELAAGRQPDELLARHPDLDPDDLRACFALAREILTTSRLPADLVHPPAPPLPGSEETATLPPAPGPPADPANLTVSSAADAGPAEPGPARRVTIPGYEVLDELGRGGMGVVYRARHLRLNRVVALKMILAGEHASEDLLARFQREAQVVARMQHPGIVQIFEIGEHDGHSFLALEFVPGGSLAARLTTEPWPAEEAALLVEKVARAVQVAHQNGIIHRDLKPENILLGNDGEPRVTDFGLAKQLESSDGRTRTGEVMGTPSYMAPEQAAGRKEIGPAADIHALGVLLHRLLSGRLPFEGPTTFDILLNVLETEPTPLRQLVAKVPRDLETITLKCLHKDSGKRYASAAELADDLRRHLEGEPIRARTTSLPERAWRWVIRDPFRTVGWLVVCLMISSTDLPGIIRGSGAGPGGILTGVLLLLAFLRARVRPLTLGTLGGIALAGIMLGFTYDLWGPGSIYDPRFFRLDLVLLFAGLALLVGTLVGALFTERFFTLYFGLLLLVLCCVMGYPYTFSMLAYAVLPAFSFGLVTRLVHYRWGGLQADVLLGAVFGATLGSLLPTFLSSALALFRLSRPDGSGWFSHFGWMILLVTLGGILGAYLGTRRSRQRAQRTSSPATGS